MQFSIDRRTAVRGMAGATLGYGVATMVQARDQDAGEQVSARPLAEADIRAKFAERPSVRDKGARGNGVTMDAAAIQDALRSFDTVWVPPGIYLIDAPLTLPSYCVLAFSSDAVFCPAHDGMTIFNTGEVSYASRILAPRVHARGKRDVTAFDLQGFRHRAEIQHPDIQGCARGIVLRELCWDTLIYMPWIRETARPIIIANGSNAVDVIHPGIDGFDTGIEIATGPQHTTTSVRIWGGYVQNGRCGIIDKGAMGTVVDGTYFEGLGEADIILSGSVRPNLSRTQHYGDKGQTGIRMTKADGASVFDPTMTNGSRSIGLYDIDDLSRNATRFDGTTEAGLNRPLGRLGSSGILVREEQGLFKPVFTQNAGSVTYVRQEGRWRRTGGQVTVAIDVVWRGLEPGQQLLVSGMPPLPPYTKPLAANAAAIVAGSGPGQTYARLEQSGDIRLMMMDEGSEKPLLAGTSGSVSVTITCLL